MDLQVLKTKFQEESVKDEFSELDYYYMEISSLLLANAKDDINNHSSVCRLIQDLQNLRASKIRKGLEKLTPSTSYIQLTNIASFELQAIRRLLPATYDGIDHIK